jgi:putative FmdB family regulatory protein
MPLYQYACKQCEHQFKTLVFEGDEVECPRCRSRQLEKQWSVPAKPKTDASLPMRCQSSGPPCGPACS